MTSPRRRWLRFAVNALWLIGGLLMLFPLLWMVVSSVKPSNLEIFTKPFSVPSRITFENYENAIRDGHIGSYFINSLWVTGLTAWGTVVFGAWGGFALSKSRFPGQRLWLGVFFLGMILPVQSYLIPLVDVLRWFQVHDSLWALILPYTAQNLPVAVLLFAAYFKSLPGEVEEAARLDGVSTGRFYASILLPMARPAVATVVVISCLNTWNEFLMAMLLIVDPDMRTLPAGMIAFEAAHSTDYPSLLAGLSLISVPTLLVYALFHNHIFKGVTAGAIK